jgi:hypothetical protein
MASILKSKFAPLGLALVLIAAVIAGIVGTASAKGSAKPTAAAAAKAAGTTKSDCPFTVEKPFVKNGRLYARGTVNCKAKHTITLSIYLRRPNVLGGTSYIAYGKKQLTNFKGKYSHTTSISCNEVSPRTNYFTEAVLNDVRFLGYPIEVDDKMSGAAKGC